MGWVKTENAQYAELLNSVELGRAVVLTDERVEGKRCQVIACVEGEEFRITRWTEDARGGWRADHPMRLPYNALVALDSLSRRTNTPLPSPPPDPGDPRRIRIGDIVRVAGGARMEVTGITNRDIAWCAWTVNGATRTEPFSLEVLRHAKDLLGR